MAFAEVSTALALLSDRELRRRVDAAAPLGTGIGGTSALLPVEGVPVFVKRVPLTDRERRPEHVRSTANVFGLPVFCQWGVGSPGFGAWRELAANIMATNWVLAGEADCFPVLYHWRVLPGAGAEQTNVEEAVTYWGGSPGVRDRWTALAAASASLVLFSEYVPLGLRQWLAGQLAAGRDAVSAAAVMAERRLRADMAWLDAHGLAHFDAHFGNVLTDGQRLVYADLGLATSARFDLSAPELRFLARNRTHDAAYAMASLVNWLVAAVAGVPVPVGGAPTERNAYIRECAGGAEPAGVPPAVADIIRRNAPVASVLNDFYADLFGTSRDTPYPADAVAHVWR